MAIGKFSEILELAEYSMQAYEKVCHPVCQKLGMTQTAFDILMFLANNPRYQTASDIVEMCSLKANLVSFHVERLVQEGYLNRQSIPEDRRKCALICTEKAQSVIEQGRKAQQTFREKLRKGISEEMLETMKQITVITKANISEMLDGR